jgi:WD40 repeat protein
VEPKTGARLATLAHPVTPVYDAAFLPDGRVVTVANRSLFVWRGGATWAIEARRDAERALTAVATSRDGANVYAAGDSRGTLWDTATWTARDTGFDDGAYAAAFSPDGTAVAVGGASWLQYVDVASGTPHEDLHAPPGQHHTELAFSPAGTWLATAAWSGSGLVAFPSRQMLAKLDAPATAAAVCPDGEHVVFGSSDGTSLVYSARALLAR